MSPARIAAFSAARSVTWMRARVATVAGALGLELAGNHGEHRLHVLHAQIG